MNSVPPYVRKLHFLYEVVCTSSKWSWSIYRTARKCRWNIYRTSRKRHGTLRVVHKVERRSPTVFASHLWEMPLLCNNVSHWLGVSLESDLNLMKHHTSWSLPSGFGILESITGNIQIFSIISQLWEGTGSWNHSSWKTRTYLFCIFNAMVADSLAAQRARASAAMVLTKISWNIPISVPQKVGILYHRNPFVPM